MKSGKLEIFSETGTEGLVWTFHPDDKKDDVYGWIVINEGDRLRVGNLFDGIIHKDRATNFVLYRDTFKCPADYATRFPEWWQHAGQQLVSGFWVHWTQPGVAPEEWLRWFDEGLEAEWERPAEAEGVEHSEAPAAG